MPLPALARPVAPPPPAEDRVPAVTTKAGGRAVQTPQWFHDRNAVDAATCCGAAMSLGPYTHTAIADGDWSNPTIWDAGTVPGANAVVNVGSFDVTYDVESDLKIKDINVGGQGTFRFATHKDTRLWVDTLMCAGAFLLGEAGNAVTESATPGKPRAEIVFWQSTAPGATTRLGLNCTGPVRVLGADKTSRLRGATDLRAGRDTFRIEGLSRSNWRVGDKILFVATEHAGTSVTDAQYAGPTQFYGPFEGSVAVRTRTLGYMQSQDEVRTITNISGETLRINVPLTFDHKVQSGTLPHGQLVRTLPPVCLLSRSIRFRSDDPSALQKRGHTMFMFHDDIDCRGAEFKDLGRTDTDPSLVRPEGTPAYATNGGTLITNSNNVRGRYPVHLHWTGPFHSRRLVPVIDCSVWGESHPIPGWAMTHHASRAAMDRNVVYNARGAGLVSELGNEIGQWVGNTVAWCRGDGFDVSWGSRAEQWTNHNGHAGVGFESQARQVLQQDNIASSCHFAWFFMQQDTQRLDRVPEINSLRYQAPVTQGGGLFGGVTAASRPYYGVEQAQIPDFDDNVGYASGVFFGVAHRQFTDRTDTTPMIARRCHAFNTRTGFRVVNYTFNYGFYDFLWSGTGLGSGASIGNVSWQIMLVNGLIRNHATGIANIGLGHNVNGEFVDIAFENCAVTANDVVADWNLTSWYAANPGKTFPQDHALFNFTDQWQTEINTSTRWKGILKRGQPYTSAQLPVPYPSLPRGPGGVEPAPGTPKPYFTLDAGADTGLTPTGAIDLWGLITDRVGVRHWPETYSSESFSPSSPNYGRPHHTNFAATGVELVERNGCFNDAGVWKMRLWFHETERLSGDHFTFPVDVTLTGFDTAFLTANTVVPTPPETPLRREAVGRPRPYVPDLTPPVIVSSATPTVAENEPLGFVLKANNALGGWAITGGADAALFEINASGGVTTLRWVGNVTRDFEAPQDADGNNAYAVTVRFTLPNGVSATQTLAVTVLDKNEGVVPTFSDGFARADEPLENSPNWFRVGGTPGRAVVTGNYLHIPVNGAAATAYLSPNTGSLAHAAQSVCYGGGHFLCASLTDADNFVGCRRNGPNVELVSRVGGVDTVLGTWAGDGNAVLRIELVSGVATVKRQGVTLGSATVTPAPPATTRVGLVTGTSGPWAIGDDFSHLAL